MAWVRIDDQFPDHPKIEQVGPLGMAMQVAALCYANRYLTDGNLPSRAVAKFMPTVSYDPETGESITWRDVAQSLVDEGVWTEVDDGYEIHGYLEYQHSRAHVERVRKKRAEAGRRGGRASAKARAKQSAGKVPSKERSKQGDKKEAKSNPKPNPKPNSIKDLKDRPPSPPEDDYTVEFEQWWAKYPRKVRKREAFNTWRSLLKKSQRNTKPPTTEELMAAVQNYAAECQQMGTDPSYIMHGSTFLSVRNRPFEDYVAGIPTPPPAQEPADVPPMYGSWEQDPEQNPHRRVHT